MKIYLSHSSKYDYKNNIYEPIKNSIINKENEIFFPHEDNKETIKSKDIIKESDLMIAEISMASVSQGIEIGWAEALETKILCIYKKGEKISSAFKFITADFIEYENIIDMIEKIIKYLRN